MAKESSRRTDSTLATLILACLFVWIWTMHFSSSMRAVVELENEVDYSIIADKTARFLSSFVINMIMMFIEIVAIYIGIVICIFLYETLLMKSMKQQDISLAVVFTPEMTMRVVTYFLSDFSMLFIMALAFGLTVVVSTLMSFRLYAKYNSGSSFRSIPLFEYKILVQQVFLVNIALTLTMFVTHNLVSA